MIGLLQGVGVESLKSKSVTLAGAVDCSDGMTLRGHCGEEAEILRRGLRRGDLTEMPRNLRL